MWGWLKRQAVKVLGIASGVFAFAQAKLALAAISVPDLSTSDIDTAGSAILTALAVVVVIGVVIRLFKKI